MALYYAKHKVHDYDHWRPSFDGDQERLAGAGTRCVSVMRSADNPNEVHFLFDIADFQAFISLMQNPESQEILKKAGVLEHPNLYKLQEMVPEPA